MLEKYALIKVMRELLAHPSRKYSVSDAARESGVSKFAAKRGLDWMFGNGMLTLEKVGKAYQYSADLGNFLARQWKIAFSAEEITAAGLVPKILKKAGSVSSIILYGSAAVGRDDEKSDLDILVVADVSTQKKREIFSAAHGAPREMTIQVYTPGEWRKKAASDKIFYEHVVIDSVLLYGEKPVVL